MANTTILALQGLSCGHCTASVKKALDARPDVESAVVTLDFAKVTGDADAQSLISTIEDAGYEAQIADKPGTILQLSGCQQFGQFVLLILCVSYRRSGQKRRFSPV